MRVKIEVVVEDWPYLRPFRIARGVETRLQVIAVSVTDGGGNIGRGEAAGVEYDGETISQMLAQVAGIAALASNGMARTQLAGLLPPGGARNALDCALWDLEAKASGIPVRERLGLGPARPILTASTIGIGTVDEVEQAATALGNWPLIKVKLDRTHHVDTVRAVRRLCPNARLIVDPNQGWTLADLQTHSPALADLGVELIEQPLPVGLDGGLAQYRCPIALAADESCTTAASIPALADRYSFVNLKLDKTGGLTEALVAADEARRSNLGVMVGCMAGTSLAMAPALLVAETAEYVDLDGPMLHATDRPRGLRYSNGMVYPADGVLWG